MGARKSQEPCMFCMPEPCQCIATVKKTAAPKKARLAKDDSSTVPAAPEPVESIEKVEEPPPVAERKRAPLPTRTTRPPMPAVRQNEVPSIAPETSPPPDLPQEEMQDQRRSGISNISSKTQVIDPELDALRNAITVLCTSGLVSAESIEANRDDVRLPPQEANLLIWNTRRREWQSANLTPNTPKQ